jgi:hypothetical protein
MSVIPSYKMHPIKPLHDEFGAVIERVQDGLYVWSTKRADVDEVEAERNEQFLELMRPGVAFRGQLGYIVEDMGPVHGAALQGQYRWVHQISDTFQDAELSYSIAGAW